MMKRRILAALLAGAMILSLAACGGKTGGTSNPGASSGQTDASQPDGSGADISLDTLALNSTEITLNKEGATFQLRYTTVPEIDAEPTYTSSDETVATVDGSGAITAVAPGKTTVIVECGGLAAAASVTCDWEEETPDASTPAKPSGDTPKPADNKPAASKVDLADFYTAITGKYEFGFLSLADSEILDALYSGLTGIGTEQCQVYYCQMSMNNGEFGLVQVKDGKDVDAVKAVFQARIDYMVGDGNGPGGAQYPMAMDSWENNSRIVTNGNYIMMVVHENADDIVKEFNALF